ncbi:hypothetical protein [Litchfieldia alkalitelluris]|uniref:hypothetical protein n=1 Tax=Litchfieldia alkalitelluris TaxID=304268 RepID=UPI001592EDA0|nr:hypothetical protein [Litchfieldia alkalitelluris]
MKCPQRRCQRTKSKGKVGEMSAALMAADKSEGKRSRNVRRSDASGQKRRKKK